MPLLPRHQRISNKMQYPVIDILVFGHEAEFESTMPFTRSSALDDKNIPLTSSFLKYSRILCAAFKWGFIGFVIYWLNWWTSKVISGLVTVKYSGLPTSLLYMLVLPRISPSYVLSLMFYSIGVLTGLQQIEPASFSISNALLWQRVIPFSNRVTSNPRKNFKSPKSLSLNF